MESHGGEHEIEVRRRFDDIAESYDRRWPRYVADSAEGTLARIDLTGAGAVLDVGCGTGVLLEGLARRLGSAGGSLPGVRLAGVDLSPGMLAVARARLGARASLVAGDAARLTLRSAIFDAALSASALHHWPDPELALAEIRRVLAPAGRVTITDWCADSPIDWIRSWLRRRLESIHIRAYRASELHAMLTRAGFRDIRVERWRLGWRWGLMTAVATRPR